ncbi:MAG: UDP-3-O-(3-hydroxymyristoyl)glucosamine N-acyltransferase [Candidatus Omnitrophica bacterium]|nr:UDP-3-O-(3-hydroxymyristoyl)glucosamine N-acyltransferase [Candidatus Omnitrophota bacterium]
MQQSLKLNKTLKEIAKLIDGEIVGNADITISGVCGIKEAKKGDITFIANPKYLALMDDTKASAIITDKEVNSASKPIVRVENPSLAFSKVVSFISNDEQVRPKGIHPAAIIGEAVKLGKDVGIGAYVVIEDGCEIGDSTVIYPGCFVGTKTKIGKQTLIYPNVSIREKITIGNRVVIHSGSVIGSEGFGFTTVGGVHQHIPQIGTVVIEDDVDIGSNVTIDRARFDKTIIGKGTKIDNLVQIAHNVIVGENSIIVAQVGISGSTKIGKNVILAGQAGLAGHIEVGDDVIVAGRSGVTKSVPAKTKVFGFPAKPYATAMRIHACVQRLPKLYNKIDELEKQIKELKEEIKRLRKNR